MRAKNQSSRARIVYQMSQFKIQIFSLLIIVGVLSATIQAVSGSIDTRRTKENSLEPAEMASSNGTSKCNNDQQEQQKQLQQQQQSQQQQSQQQQQHISDANSLASVHDLEPAATTNTRPKSTRLSRLNEISSLRNKCTLAERELDKCASQLIGLGQSASLTYPDSMQDLDTVYCPKFRETVACVRNNTDCYKPFERQIINWILSSTKRMNYKRCKNENEKIRFLKLTSSCFALMKNPMDDCMGRYIGQLDAIAEYNRDLERLSEDDYQIQLSCCANKRFKQCVMNSARQGCQSHDSLKKLRRTNSLSSQRAARKQLQRVVQDTMDDLKTTLNEMALTGPEFICHGIDENFCKSKFDGRYSNRVARHRSIVPAMIKIYANK